MITNKQKKNQTYITLRWFNMEFHRPGNMDARTTRKIFLIVNQHHLLFQNGIATAAVWYTVSWTLEWRVVRLSQVWLRHNPTSSLTQWEADYSQILCWLCKPRMSLGEGREAEVKHQMRSEESRIVSSLTIRNHFYLCNQHFLEKVCSPSMLSFLMDHLPTIMCGKSMKNLMF